METKDWQIEIITPHSALDEWDAFVDSSPQGSIFCKSWWLQAVAPNAWQIPVVTNGSQILAGLPLVLSKVRGVLEIQMPYLTQTLGPIMKTITSEKYATRLSTEMNLMEHLIHALPPYRRLTIRCHPTITNWLPFYWAGCSQTTRYTYAIEDLSDLSRLWDGMESNIRGKVRKAEKAGIKIEETSDLTIFFSLVKKTFNRQGLQVPYSLDLVDRLNSACEANHARKIFLARDREGQIHSALFVVYDKNCMYNLMQGGDPELRSSGANLAAMWHSIQFANTVTRRYDFEGSMLRNVEPIFRGMGGVQKATYLIFDDKRDWIFKTFESILNKDKKKSI